ncbi:MAG: hypothetical protein ACTHJ7_11255, partial [Candidatus Nitrosocosmicus sp.]
VGHLIVIKDSECFSYTLMLAISFEARLFIILNQLINSRCLLIIIINDLTMYLSFEMNFIN